MANSNSFTANKKRKKNRLEFRERVRENLGIRDCKEKLEPFGVRRSEVRMERRE